MVSGELEEERIFLQVDKVENNTTTDGRRTEPCAGKVCWGGPIT